MTRGCLEVLLAWQFPVSILTKSKLVLRDKDLFKKFKECEVGLTITTDDEKIKQIFEPNSPSIKERIETLKELHDERIETYVFVGPILPQNPEKLASKLVGKIDWALIDKMNYSYKVAKLYKQHKLEWALEEEYFNDVAKTLEKSFREAKIPVTFCF